jgi:hypothetical protein
MHGSPATRRLGCLILLVIGLLSCGGLGVLVNAGQGPALIYPGAVPHLGTPAQQLGLYGAYETADSVEMVAAWYARQGVLGQRELLAGRPSASGRTERPWWTELPVLGRRLPGGRVFYYRAVAAGPRTVINLWCDPPCRPDDSPLSGLPSIP